jgi:hypothetical protein
MSLKDFFMEYELTWERAKDGLVIGLASLIVFYLGSMFKEINNRQIETNTALAELKKDIAVLSANRVNDCEDLRDLQDRIKVLEKRAYKAKEKYDKEVKKGK